MYRSYLVSMTDLSKSDIILFAPVLAHSLKGMSESMAWSLRSQKENNSGRK